MNRHTTLVRLLRNMVLIDLAVFILVFLVGLAAGWRTVSEYSQGLIIAGALLIGAGGMSAIGRITTASGFTYQMGESAGMDNISQRTQRSVKDSRQSLTFLIDSIVVGILPILAGVLLDIAF